MFFKLIPEATPGFFMSIIFILPWSNTFTLACVLAVLTVFF